MALHPWGSGTATDPRCVSLYELHLIVADRNRLERLGAPTVSAIEVGRLPRRARTHAYAVGPRRTTSTFGPRLDKAA